MPHKFGAQLWFKSDLFAIEPGEDEETNPLCYGRQLANWLRTKLIEKGYTVEEVIPEDWGWCVMCARKPFMLWVGCVSVHDYEKTRPENPPPSGKDVTWSCMVTAEPPFLAGLLKRIEVEPALSDLSKHVANILAAEPSIALVPEP
jgi:hypothetical protein